MNALRIRKPNRRPGVTVYLPGPVRRVAWEIETRAAERLVDVAEAAMRGRQ